MLPLAPVELSLQSVSLPLPGAETAQPHVLGEEHTGHSLSLIVEAPAGSNVTFHVMRNGTAAARLIVNGGSLVGDAINVTLPQGSGWMQQRMTLRW